MFWEFVKKNPLLFIGLAFFLLLGIGLGVGLTVTGVFAPFGGGLIGIVGAGAILFASTFIPAAVLLGIPLRNAWNTQKITSDIQALSSEVSQNTRQSPIKVQTTSTPNTPRSRVSSRRSSMAFSEKLQEAALPLNNPAQKQAESVTPAVTAPTNNAVEAIHEQKSKNLCVNEVSGRQMPTDFNREVDIKNIWSMDDEDAEAKATTKAPAPPIPLEEAKSPTSIKLGASPISQPNPSSSSSSSSPIPPPLHVTQAEAEKVANHMLKTSAEEKLPGWHWFQHGMRWEWKILDTEKDKQNADYQLVFSGDLNVAMESGRVKSFYLSDFTGTFGDMTGPLGNKLFYCPQSVNELFNSINKRWGAGTVDWVVQAYTLKDGLRYGYKYNFKISPENVKRIFDTLPPVQAPTLS